MLERPGLREVTGLLLERDLRTSEKGSEVRTLARARTLTVLGRLDPSRKTALMQFLVEADLVQRVDGREPIISLSGANLSDVFLNGALRRAPRGHAPYVRAEWLEETVWADVRQFLRDPLERFLSACASRWEAAVPAPNSRSAAPT
jgi:hypothetical protein